MKIPPPKWPQVWECAKCRGQLIVYPRPEPRGLAICYACTPYARELEQYAKDISVGYPGYENFI